MQFTVSQATKLLGVTRSTLRQWLDLGFIRASILKAPGTGIPHLFSKGDLYHIATFQRLLDLGVNRGIAAVWLRGLDFDELQEQGARYILLTGMYGDKEGKRNFYPWELTVGEEEELCVKVGNADLYCVMNFKRISAGIDAQLE